MRWKDIKHQIEKALEERGTYADDFESILIAANSKGWTIKKRLDAYNVVGETNGEDPLKEEKQC